MLSLKRERRARAQRGSVLSALLIIVAFLAILGGALMNEISSQFLITRTLEDRVATEATLNSSLESGIGQLENRPLVPFPCSTDPGVAVNPVSLNGQSASVISKPTFFDPKHLGYCQAIVPDFVTPLPTGPSQADGTHVTIGSRNTYLVGDAGNVYNYSFGLTGNLWKVSVGATVTGPPAQSLDGTRAGHLMTVVPVENRVALIDDNPGAGASLRCYMGAAATVTSRPGFENAPGGESPFFPNYVYFGDSSGKLYVYDATTDGSCAQIVSPADLGGPVVGGPLVLKGQQQRGDNPQCGSRGGDEDRGQVSTTVDIFAVINRGGGRLVHYQYCEMTQGGQGITNSLNFVESRPLSIGNAAGVAFSSTKPSGDIQLAVTSLSGYVAMATIIVRGDSYSISTGPTKSFGGSFTRAPYWWHSTGGDRIGAGNQNSLLVLDTSLNVSLRYDGAVGITTTPGADSNGDWYFGADDGHVYDVERPASGIQMFKAARFGAGGQVSSSPIVGAPSDGCSGRVCMYFGTNGNGAYLAQIGNGRVMDLNACSTSGSGSTSCIPGTQQLWARLEVGVANQAVNVIAWSYYDTTPPPSP